MIKRLLLFGFIATILFMVRRILRRASLQDRAGSAGRGTAPTYGGKLVRDRVCNTYVPEATALSLSETGLVHYFCSHECRQRYLDDSNGSSSSAMVS